MALQGQPPLALVAHSDPHPEWAILSTSARTNRTRVKDTAPPVPVGVKQLDRTLKIEWRAIEKVLPYPNNPRDNEHAVPDVAASLVAFGWQQPIVVDKAGIIVVGHTRWKAARAIEQKLVPVILFRGTEAQAKAYRLADNKYGERAEWNYAALSVEFEGLKEMGADLAMTGFREFEIAPIVAADWSPGTPSSTDLSEHQRSDGGSNNGIFKFLPDQMEVLLRAVEKYRAESENPHVELQEAVTRICSRYAPN